MALGLSTRSDLYRRALELIPGGVNSPVRAMKAVGLDEPFFVSRGDGAYLVDVDGNRYLDWVLSWGPLLFGHADSETVEAVREAALRGTTFGATTEAEVELAAEIADAVPSVEKVRLVSSGTEAAMSALRLARGFTSRDRILKFAGCYHGHSDALLASAGSGLATLGIPVVARRAVGRDRRHDRRPVQRRRRGRRRGDALRRRARGDHRRAGRREHGRRPAGGRLPRGAARALRRVGRAARVRRGDHRLPRRPRRRAGALRRHARPDDPRQDRRRRPPARRVRRPRRRDGPARAVRPRLPGRARSRAIRSRPRRASRCCGGCATRPSTTSSSAAARGSRPGSPGSAGCSASARCSRSSTPTATCATSRTRRRATPSGTAAFFRHLLERGIYIAPSQFEAMFLSLVHGDEEIDRTIEAVGEFYGSA